MCPFERLGLITASPAPANATLVLSRSRTATAVPSENLRGEQDARGCEGEAVQLVRTLHFRRSTMWRMQRGVLLRFKLPEKGLDTRRAPPGLFDEVRALKLCRAARCGPHTFLRFG